MADRWAEESGPVANPTIREAPISIRRNAVAQLCVLLTSGGLRKLKFSPLKKHFCNKIPQIKIFQRNSGLFSRFTVYQEVKRPAPLLGTLES
jgi:hypothetical protein